MTGKTHIAIGISAALTISIGQPIENQVFLVLASAIGSLIPDLDHPRGKLNQKLLLVSSNFCRILFYISLGVVSIYLSHIIDNNTLKLLGIILILIGISSHRSFTHSIVGFLASASIVKVATISYGLSSIYSGFVIGYGLHLIADFFNPKGIQLFYPLNMNVAFPITIKTNSSLEKMLFMLLSVYSVWILFGYLNF